jgi:hypothetical protein
VDPMVNVNKMSVKDKFLVEPIQRINERGNILKSATVYLSGPMDFVTDRE